MTMKHGDNPADHNVEDVATYLEGATSEQRAAVFEAEAAEGGKQRAGVLSLADKYAEPEVAEVAEVADDNPWPGRAGLPPEPAEVAE